MKIDKQTRDAILLGVFVVVLIVVASFQLKGIFGTPAVRNTPRPTASGTRAAASRTTTETKVASAKTESTGKISWINPSRVTGIVNEVKGGRDPFENLLPGAQPDEPRLAGPTKPIKPNWPTGPGPTPWQPGPTVPPVMVERTLTKTLTWVKPEALAKAFEDENLAVDLKAGKQPNQVVIVGESPDFEKAVEITNTLDTEPPIPPFALTGIITSPGTKLAVIVLGDKQYTVSEYDAIPGQGWTITRITPMGVTLKKGKQTVSLRLSGGSAS